MTVTIDSEKAGIRRTIHEALAALGDVERARRGRLAADRAEALPELRAAATVLFFRSLAAEIQTESLFSGALARGQRVYAPRIEGGGLVFVRIGPETRWRRGPRLAIEEPEGGALLAAGELPALAIVPGLAFSERCDRLGRGGGHYDRALAAAPLAGRVRTVGLSLDLQVLREIPVAAHDVPVDLVVTESRTIRRGGP